MSITKKQTTALAVAPSEEKLALLKSEFPQEEGYTRNLYPRLGMYSQDVTEEIRDPKTKKKEIKLVTEAGTFYTERQGEEENAEGKKEWVREEIGTDLEATIIFQRKQLRHYDESTEEYTSSPIFDTNDEVVKLFRDKKEVAHGTPAELKALPEYQIVKDGKMKSSLEDNRILYVLYQSEIYQMNLRGSSMYSFMTYAKSENPPAVLTEFTSEAMEKGDIAWNKMMYKTVRQLSDSEVDTVLEHIQTIKTNVAEEKAFYASKAPAGDTGFGAFDDKKKEEGIDD